MSESESPVVMFDNGDPAMQRAYEAARATFRYFWREIAWERRRIVPALDLTCVKAPFTDAQPPADGSGIDVEHMWISDVDFDGTSVGGILANSPNWLKSVSEGDPVRVTLSRISDWMYAIDGEVYGGFTVKLMRSRMSEKERRDHDTAWGLKFGDPSRGERVDTREPHPMSENMVGSLKEHLAKTPSAVSATGFNGWTLLHQDASAGSLATVAVLLEAGADPSAKADDGTTPLQLAEALGWQEVAQLLRRK